MLLEGTVPNSAGPTLPRYYAMMHIAMFDAVNSIEGGYSPYRTKVPAWRLASTGSGCRAGCARCFGRAVARRQGELRRGARQPSGNPQSRARAARLTGRHRSREENPRMARERRLGDSADVYTARGCPASGNRRRRLLPPATFVQAGDAKPFGLPTPYYYLPRRPPELNSQEYADAVNDIKAIGGATSAVRTGEQTQLARAWAASVTASNGRRSGTSHARYGRSQGLTSSNVAPVCARECDHARQRADRAGQQVCLQALASGDGDPARGRRHERRHHADPTWMPLLTTPPYPSYAGNMACIGAAYRARWRCSSAPTTLPFTVAGPASMAMRTSRVVPGLLAARRSAGREP